MGPLSILARLPRLVRRVRETAAAAVAAEPHAVVIIDSPEFTHPIAKRIRRKRPDIPIVDYVSPSVWAWRPGRARAMRRYVDHLLALLPFEPEVHRRLGGPPCTYVGHPLLERIGELRPSTQDRKRRASEPPLVLVLPGSRRLEIKRLGRIFGETIGHVAAARGEIELVLPTLPALAERVAEAVQGWPVRPAIVTGEAEKFAAMRRARAALAASGTVTLELALSGVPQAVAYRVRLVEEMVYRPMISVPSIVLPNLVLGENAVPEFIQRDCTAEKLSAALLPLLDDGPARKRQLDACARLDDLFATGGEAPSDRAARAVIEAYEGKTGRRVNQN
jgi:lipid-A-disaccharide synthase